VPEKGPERHAPIVQMLQTPREFPSEAGETDSFCPRMIPQQNDTPWRWWSAPALTTVDFMNSGFMADSAKPDFRDAVQQQRDGVLLRVYVQPKARNERIVGLHGDRLKVAVMEPPDQGKANDAVVDLLARAIGLAASGIRLIRGQTTRQKDLLIVDSTIETIVARLNRRF